MPALGRSRAGHKAKRIGEAFEALIARSAARDDITAIRIPDSCRRVRRGASIQLMQIRSPFDYVLLRCGQAITMDAKTVDADTFSYSSICQHQIHSLSLCARDALQSGYLIWYRLSDRVVWHPAQTVTLPRRWL
jgi:penicillin-binding protein-related factor A (putative recombinase)